MVNFPFLNPVTYVRMQYSLMLALPIIALFQWLNGALEPTAFLAFIFIGLLQLYHALVNGFHYKRYIGFSRFVSSASPLHYSFYQGKAAVNRAWQDVFGAIIMFALGLFPFLVNMKGLGQFTLTSLPFHVAIFAFVSIIIFVLLRFLPFNWYMPKSRSEKHFQKAR